MLKQPPPRSHPLSPGAPRCAAPRARPQRGRSPRRTAAVRRRGRSTENTAGELFQQPQIEKAFAPHYGQGRRLHALRGTTLVRQRMTSGHPSPFIGPLRERSGIHYSGFTDSAQRRVRRYTDRLAPPAGSLKSVRLAYYSSSSPYDLGSITGWSDLERGFFPTAFAINQNTRSVGPINA